MAQLRAKQIKLAADGDLIIGGASGSGQLLTKGTAGQVLKVLTGGALGYEKVAAADTTFNKGSSTLTSTNVEAALQELAALAGSGVQGVKDELDAVEASVGLNANGTYTAPAGTYVNTPTTVKAALAALDAGLVQEVAGRGAADTALGGRIDNAVADIAGLVTEVGNIETAVGLSATGERVAWTSTNFVGSDDSFAGAINHIDGKVKTALDAATAALAAEAETRGKADAQEVIDRNAAITTAVGAEQDRAKGVEEALQAELDATQVGAGLGKYGAYTAATGANYIATATSLKDADDKLDAALKTTTDGLATEVTNRGTEDVATRNGAGLVAATGAYESETGSNYIKAATTLKGADLLLDAAIKKVAGDLAALGSGSLTGVQNEVDHIEAGLGFAAETGTKPDFTVHGHYAANATVLAAIEGIDGALTTAEADIDTLQARVEGLAGLGALHFVGTVGGNETDTTGLAADTTKWKNGNVYRVTTTASKNWAGTGLEVNTGDYVVVTDTTANGGAGAWVKFDNTDPTVAAADGETAIVVTGGVHEGFKVALTKKTLSSTSDAIVITGGANSTIGNVSVALDPSKIKFAALGDAGAPAAAQDGKYLKWNNTTKQVEYVSAGQLGATVKVDEDFTPAAAANVSVTLTSAPVGSITVYMNGVKLKNSGFTVSGSTVTLVDANNGYPYEDNDVISVTYTKSAA